MGLPRLNRLAMVVAAASAVVVALSGCVEGASMPVPTYTASNSSSASPTPTAPPRADPILRPGGNAAQNAQFFDFVNAAHFAANGMSSGEAIINNLVASGFVKTDMEVTYDRTAIGLAADAIIFSVKFGDRCLIGQVDPQGYTGIIAPLLGTGKCLIGETKPIDW